MLETILKLKYKVAIEKEHTRSDKESAQNLYNIMVSDVNKANSELTHRIKTLRGLISEISSNKEDEAEFLIRKATESLSKAATISKRLERYKDTKESKYKYKDMYVMYTTMVEYNKLETVLNMYIESITKWKLH